MEQRELKFRVWDTEVKCMVIPLEMKFMFEDMNKIMVVGASDQLGMDHHVFPEHLVLMQYTGLKDRAGKEIYEGDVVIASRTVYTSTPYKADRIDSKTTQGVIEIDPVYGTMLNNGRHRFPIEKYYEHTYRQLRGEVIGNIYENPELLK